MARRPPPALRALIDETVRQGIGPVARNQGLFVRAPGRARGIRLFDQRGDLNPAGRYYFQRRAQDPPDRRYDPAQQPVIVGRREQIRLNDGAMAVTRTFHGGRWRPTALGLQFYRDRRENYLVFFPVDVKYTHENGRVSWGRNERLESTATALGIVTVPAGTDLEQEAEVRRRVVEFVEGLSSMILAEDYYVERILHKDWRGNLEFRRETVTANESMVVAATQRRPLQGRPWLYCGMHAVADAAFDDTDGHCMSHQLLTLARRDGEAVWNEAALEAELQRAYEKLYPDPHFDWREDGVTCEMAREVCVAAGVPLYVSWNDHKIMSYQPETGVAPLALVIRGNHAYFLDDAATKRHLGDAETRMPRNLPSRMVAVEKTRERLPESQWLDLAETLEPGQTYRARQDEMHQLRIHFHQRHVVPKVKLASATRIASLTVPFPKSRAGAKIVALPACAEECRKFCRTFSERVGAFPYYGEGMEALCQRALEALMRPPSRKCVTDEVQVMIFRRQQGCCNGCGDPLTHPYHIDHRVPRASGGGDAPDNLQALCVTCHCGKSASECTASVGETNCLKSRFNRETYKLFHMSPKPPQLVANLHEQKACHGAVYNVDIIRCRFTGLMSHRGTLPVFSPTDDIRPCEGSLGDYNYVLSCSSRKSAVGCLPFHGSGWYGRESCRYMLDHRIVEWSDITHVFSAAAQIPSEYLRERLELVEQCWEGPSKKAAMNSLLGLWAKKTRYVYNCYTTSDINDVLFDGQRYVGKAPGTDGVLEDVICRTELLSYDSMRPIHQICLEYERLCMAKALYIIHQFCEVKRVLSLHVDGIYLQPGKSAPRLREIFETLTHDQLHVRDMFEIQRCLSGGSIASGPPVYRFQAADPVFPGGAMKEPVVAPLELPELAWTDETEVTVPCLVTGSPGFGKSWTLLELKKRLEEAGEKVAVVSPYHVAAKQLNCGATTVHSFVHRNVIHGSFKGTILLDEYGVLSVELAAALEHACLAGCRIVCFGDPDQLRAIEPTWRGRPVSSDAFVESRLLKLWTDCRRVRLTTYRRGSDPSFASWYISVRHREDAVAEALRCFPCTDRRADWNLCLSHFRRRQINAREQAREAEEAERAGLRLYRVAGEDPYDMFLGTKLIGANNEHRGITTGALLIVRRVDHMVTLEDEETGEQVKVKPEVLGRYTRLRHAITLASCQGRTLRGLVRLWDARSRHMTATHIYVAASRATSGELFECK